MRWRKETLHCADHFSRTRREAPFVAVVVSCDYQNDDEDRRFLDRVLEDGVELARKVNAGAANNASRNRLPDQIMRNCVAGVLAEQLWKLLLNWDSPVVTETEYTGASTQIDLQVIRNGKKIEVRSSFPRRGIPFAICHPEFQFDIIGPYTNGYKPDEIQKEWYVRTLFHVEVGAEFLEKLRRSGFETWLAGGATWEMMADDSVALPKDLVSEDEIVQGRQGTISRYRVVPFSRALDTNQIYTRITAEA